MSILNDPVMMRAVIMDHYEYPRNKALKGAKGYCKVHMASESCIDDLYIEAKIEDNIIKDICFDGEGCTISTSSTSIMSEIIVGKSVEEALKIINEYEKMLKMEDFDEELLKEAVVFKNTGRQANRIKCALIGFNGLKEIIENKSKEGENIE